MPKVSNIANERIRLGIIGCGGIVQALHVRSLARQKHAEVAALVDQSQDNLSAVGAHFPEASRYRDISDLVDVDAVLVATPNTLHYEHTKICLEKGWHVISEKPQAIRYDQALELVQLSRSRQLAYCVNLNRRFLPNVIKMRQLIQSGEWGRPLRIRTADGVRLMGTPDGGQSYHGIVELAGGGVLLDTGSHMVDLALFLIGAKELGHIDYQDDAWTHLEAETKIKIRCDTDTGPCDAEVFLSRISPVAQTVSLECEHASFFTSLSPVASITARFPNSNETFDIPVRADDDTIANTFVDAMDSFLNACLDISRTAGNTAESALPSIDAMERCYADRKPIDFTHFDKPRADECTGVDKDGVATVGIVGAGGVLGSRLYERLLLDERFQPRAISHSTVGSVSVLRYSGDVHIGSATDPEFMDRALDQCDYVVNCAINMRGGRKFAVGETRAIARTTAEVAALKKVKRLLHISTIAVHGAYLGRVGDSLRLDPDKSTYAVAKYKSENDVIEVCRKADLECSVLRMGHIYGPYTAGWTAGQLEFVRQGKLVRVEEWANPSNTVHIDNAVDCILAAITSASSVPEPLYVTDWPNQSWREFYAPLFAVAGLKIDAVPNISFDEFLQAYEPYRSSLLTKAPQMGLDLLRPALSRDNLKRLKANTKYTRVFETIETILPSFIYDKMVTLAKNRSPAAPGIDLLRGCPAYIASSYASSIVLPVQNTVEQIGYAPGTTKERADKGVREWLEFIGAAG